MGGIHRPSQGFQLWTPTLWCHIRRRLMSDSFAWAIQNAVGVLFTVLFAVIGQMTFTLACVSACLYTAASQVLSLDRTVGGRLFSASLFTGCMLSAGLLGGVISTIAWQANGDAIGLLQYLPSEFQKLPSKELEGLILEWFPRLAAVPWPSFIQEQFKKVQTEIDEIETELMPEVASGFWILLMVLFIVISVPFAVARASKDFRLGVLMGIATLFMGSQVVFASLMPTLGLRLYWTQITLGYVKVALVNTGAMVITGLLFLSTSAHDAVRDKLGALLQNAGALMSHCGSVMTLKAGKSINIDDVKAKNLEAGKSINMDDVEAKNYNRLSNAAEIEEMLQKESALLAAVAAKGGDLIAASLQGEKIDEENLGGSSTNMKTNISAAPAHLTSLELQRQAHEIADSAFAPVLFEPPVIGIVSQPGSNMFQYKAVLQAAEKLVNVAGSIEACTLGTQFELSNGKATSAQVVDEIRSTISYVLASCAAVCADISVVLRDMPLGKPCSGSKLAWRPRPEEFYQDLQENLQDIATRLTPAIEKLATEQGIAIIDLAFVEGRATLAALANCELLVKAVANVEMDVSIALQVPNSIQTPRKTDDASLKPQKKTLKERVMQNGYAPSLLALFGIGIGLPVWLLAVKSLVDFVKGIPKFCTSSQYRTQILKSRTAQFAVKYWIALCLAIVGIILLLWKGEGTGQGSPVANIYQIDYFFFVWQPIYFWITAAICIQKQVEAAVFRSVLRSLMTVVGGVLGYCTMLNGSLAQNPYFITSMVALFNGFCGLFSPIKSLRYSLFLMAFTYNAVVVCQYVGCCDVAGDPKIFGGKVLSTLFGSLYAVLASWCILPLYTSEIMLEDEAAALRAGVDLINQQYEWIRSTGDSSVQIEQDWGEAVEDQMKAPLAAVRKEMEVNVLDRKQMMLTWNVLPTPPIVGILLERLSNLADCLATAGSVAQTSLWPRESGPAQAALLDYLQVHIDAVKAGSEAVADACTACMGATSRKSVLESREVVATKVQELRHSRAALRADFVAWNENSSHPGWTRGDYRFLAWMHWMLMAVREVEVVGLILAEQEASLDRDTYFAWASSWFGRRPV